MNVQHKISDQLYLDAFTVPSSHPTNLVSNLQK